MDCFKFSLGTWVTLAVSGEIGIVQGQACFTVDENQYLVHYSDGNGCSATAWISEQNLVHASPETN